MHKQRFNLTAAAYDVEDRRVLTFKAVDDDVFAHGKTAQAGAQVFITAASDVGIRGKKKKPRGDGINHAIRNLDAVAFLGDVHQMSSSSASASGASRCAMTGRGVALPQPIPSALLHLSGKVPH
jgi:hypothetical protein